MLGLGIAVSLFCCGIVFVYLRGNALHPSVLWCVCWGICFALFGILGSEYRAADKGLTVAFSSVAAFFIVALLCEILLAKQVYTPRRFTVQTVPVISYLALTTISGLCVLVSFASKFGFSPSNLLSITSLMESSGEASSLLHTGAEDALVLWEKVAMGLFQSGFVVFALLFGLGSLPRTSVKYYLPVAFLIAVLFSVITTVRGFVAVPMVFTLTALISGLVVSGRESKFLKPKSLGLWVGATLGFVVLLVLLQMVRLGGKASLVETMDHLRPWFAGYIPGFANWLETEQANELGLGRWFFRGLLAPLGLVSGEGFDETAYQIPLGNGQSSNALTFLRVAVADFGVFGAVACCGILGGVSTMVFRGAKSGSLLAGTLLVAVFCGVIWSPNYWFFAYGSRILSIGFACLVCNLLCISEAEPEPRLSRRIN